MADDLYAKRGDDGDYWIFSPNANAQVAVARKLDRKWYGSGDGNFFDKVGPFSTLNELIDHIEKQKLFTPWGNPGN